MTMVFYIAVMAGITYLIRMIPFTVFKKKIKSKFLQSVLYYIPYAVLSAMTFPSIFYSTDNTATAAVGTVVAIILAYFKLPLTVVAIGACVSALITGFLF